MKILTNAENLYVYVVVLLTYYLFRLLTYLLTLRRNDS